MKSAPVLANERERLSDLYAYDILDTLPESDFDHLTKIASEICHTPISLVSIIDEQRQWFKSAHGLAVKETPREVAFCAHAIEHPDDIFVVNDSKADGRFADNPLVTGEPFVEFYAGIPLVTESGHALGTLCVIDNKPKELTKSQKESLKALAQQVVALLELRRKNIELSQKQAALNEVNKELERFAYVVAHDISSPCNNMIILSDMLQQNYADRIDNEGKEMLQHLKDVSGAVKKLTEDILQHSRAVHTWQKEKLPFTFEELMEEVRPLLQLPPNFLLEYDNKASILFSSKAALLQILVNLCQNAIKYNDKPDGRITIGCEEVGKFYYFNVADNGRGMEEKDYDKIFELFETLGTKDRFDNSGHGIGLYSVKRLIQNLGGDISVHSKLGEGTTFHFTVMK